MARIPSTGLFLVLLSAVGVVVYACATNDPPSFRGGGDPDVQPEGGTYLNDTSGTSTDTVLDTAVDTAEDTSSDTADTAPPYEGTGYSLGDIAYNLVADDQGGNEWRLYQHDSGPVVLALGYGQGDDFIQICSFLPDIQSSFSSYGVQTVAVLLLDAMGTTAQQDDAAEWAATYDLDTVLFDEDGSIALDWTGSSTRTRTYVISSDMVIEYSNYDYTFQGQVESEIEDLVY